MNIPFTVDNALSAINNLHGNSDNKVKEEASNWLVELQKSNEVWHIAHELLSRKIDLNSWYFGAQTLRNKIQCSFAELNVQSHEGLRQSLMNNLLSFSSQTPIAISNQICLAMADLVCNMVSWQNPVNQLINSLSGPQHLPFLLDILRFIPEEMNNASLRLGQNRRRDIMAECERERLLFLRLLEEILRNQSSDMQMLERVFQSMSSWVDPSVDVWRDADLMNSTVVDAIFAVLQRPHQVDEAVYAAAAQCLMDIFYSINDANLYPNLLSRLQRDTYSLLPLFQGFYRSPPTSPTNGMSSAPLARQLCRVFVEMAYTLKNSMIRTPQSPLGSLNTLECVVSCVELGTRDHCLYVFDFLRDFASEITTQQNSAMIEPTTPYFARLVMSVTRHCQFTPTDAEDAEEFEEFRDSLFDLMHEVVHIIGVEQMCNELLSHLSQYFQPIKDGCAMSRENWNALEALLFILSSVVKRSDPNDNNGQWGVLVSSLLWLFSSQNGSYAVPVRVRTVVALMLGELDAWTGRHPEQRAAVHSFLVHTVVEMQGATTSEQKECTRTALSSLGILYSVPVNHQLFHQAQALGELQRLLECLPHLPWVLHDATESLFLGLGSALGALLVPSRIRHASHDSSTANLENNVVTGTLNKNYSDEVPARVLHIITSVPVDCVCQLSERKSSLGRPAHHSLSDIGVWLDYLAAVFSRLNVARQTRRVLQIALHGSVETCLRVCVDNVIVTNVWRSLSMALSAYIESDRIVEKVCRVLRYITRALGIYAAPLWPVIAQPLVQVYNATQYSVFLYLGSIFFDEFAAINDPNMVPSLMDFFRTLISPLVPQLTTDEYLRSQPDKVDDLYRLCTRVVSTCPTALLLPPDMPLEAMLDAAANAMPLLVTTSVNATLASCNFLNACLNHARHTEDEPPDDGQLSRELQLKGVYRLKEWLLTNRSRLSPGVLSAVWAQNGGIPGALLIMTVVLCSVSLTRDSDVAHDSADLIHSLKKLSPKSQMDPWFQTALNSLPLRRADGLEFVTEQQKNDLRFAVIESDSADDIYRALQKFSNLAL